MEIRFDKYTYQARLLPTLVAFVPLALGSAVWFPGQSSTWRLLGAIFISFGLTGMLSQLGRDLGKRKEPLLFQQWGGLPTTRILSHRLSRLDPLTLRRYHAKLQTLLPQFKIPTESEEIQSPTSANQDYASCVLFLRQKTYDHETFPLVFAENINYGFRRNLWALKSIGVISAMVGTVSCGVFILLRRQVEPSGLLLGIAGAVISAALLAMWLFVVNAGWVRLAADVYAERLLASLDSM
jgi:hypothetical protein